MRYYIAADHAGIEIKAFVKELFESRGHGVEDLGPFNKDRVDYPDLAAKVCEAVLSNANSKGILICGSGIGMSIAANRFKDIRAGLCLSRWMAEDGRKEDNINILCLAANYTDPGTAIAIVESFLKTKFENIEKRKRRLEKIEKN